MGRRGGIKGIKGIRSIKSKVEGVWCEYTPQSRRARDACGLVRGTLSLKQPLAARTNCSRCGMPRGVIWSRMAGMGTYRVIAVQLLSLTILNELGESLAARGSCYVLRSASGILNSTPAATPARRGRRLVN